MKLAGWLPALSSLLLILMPYGALVVLAATEWAERGAAMAFPWDGKSLVTLANGLTLSLAVALASVALAIGFALLLAKTPSRFWRWTVLTAAIIGFCLSPVIHLIAWRSLPLVLALPPFLAVTFVLAWKYCALALFMIVLGLHALEPGGIEAGSAFSSPGRAALRLVLPQIKGVLLAAGGVIFALVFAEAEVPPLLGLRVYAEEFMGRIALDPYAGTAALAAAPFVLVAALAATALAFWSPGRRSLGWSRSGLLPLLRYVRPVRRPFLMGLTVALAICWPWLALLHGADIQALVGEDWRSLTTSLALGAISLGIALGLAYPLADLMYRPARGRTGILAIMIVLVCAPGSLLGLGMIALAQTHGMSWLNAGDISLISTHGLRLAPLAALLLLALRLLEPAWMRDELRLTGASWLSGLRFIRAPLEWPKWLLIGAVLLTLLLSELASTILVVAPGTETAILRLYNLMHFGASERVAALALSQAAIVAILFATAGWLLARRHSDAAVARPVASA